MNDILALTDPVDLSPTQRAPHLAYIYMGEVYNGGHGQYFSNHEHLDHQEVIRALEIIGAREQADILKGALRRFTANQADEMSEPDKLFYECKTNIEFHLEAYLDEHESEFVEWIP